MEGIIIFNIKEKLNELSDLSKEEIWYIVKQEREFWKVCYATYILEQYKENEPDISLERYFSRKADEIKAQKGFDNFIQTHRMLRIGYFYGLIKKDSSGIYKKAELTEVYKEIKNGCNSSFENTDLYYDIIEQQIEKIYVSSVLDEDPDSLRIKYDLFPVYFLYKILLEVGRITGEYKISLTEFYVFVSTTKKYEDYFTTVYNILKAREEPGLNSRVEEISSTLQEYNRFKEVIDNLKAFEISSHRNKIRIKENSISNVKRKVRNYESCDFGNLKANYISKLCSNTPLLTVEKEGEEENNMKEPPELPEINSSDLNDPSEDNMPKNMIIYGAPGTGKTWELEDLRKKYFKDDLQYSRITLHEDFTYSDFVGSYKPTPIYEELKEDKKLFEPNKVKEKKDNLLPHIDYNFIPGRFLEVLLRALYDDNGTPYLLIIEELNRADPISVFGDVFQLLDRNENGKSEYPIELSKEAQDYITSKLGKDYNKIFIPENMYIWATMNNADQSVTRLDTAFKRRWAFWHIDINHNEEVVEDRYLKLNFLDEEEVRWNTFRNTINEYCMEELGVQEDRLIGTFFMDEIESDTEEETKKYLSQQAFKDKLLMYLRDDLFRYNPTEIFNNSYSLGKIIANYENGENIFNDRFTQKLKTNMEEN